MTSSRGGAGGPDAWGILTRLWQVMHAVLDDSAPAFEGLGLTTKAFFLLAAVEEHPFPAELARVLFLPPPTVTYLVKQAEAGGFLERRAEPGDLRKFRLALTESGRRAIAEAMKAMEAALVARMAGLDPEEVAAFDRALVRLALSGSGPSERG